MSLLTALCVIGLKTVCVYAAIYRERRNPKVKCLEILKERFEITCNITYENIDENRLAISLAVIENPDATDGKISTN